MGKGLPAGVVIAGCGLALACCGVGAALTPKSAPTDPPLPLPPAVAVESPPPSPAGPSDPVPTLTRWVGVPCSPEGAVARSISGGALVCKQVGSDPTPEWHATGGPTTTGARRTTSPPAAYYPNCAAARQAGAAPLYRGQPGYRSGLDRDGDGIACDK